MCTYISISVVIVVCPIGYYGSRCTDQCHCKDNKPCDIKTGLCSNGCNEIWNGPACNIFSKFRFEAPVVLMSTGYETIFRVLLMVELFGNINPLISEVLTI